MALPRTLGDARRSSSIDALQRELERQGADEVERFDQVEFDPVVQRSFELTTLIAHFRPSTDRRFVLATHFDVRPWADADPDPHHAAEPVPGANDGTSGVAVVLELASHLWHDLPQQVGFTVVLFDGEELGHPGGSGYCVGSRGLAAALGQGRYPQLRAAEFGIVLDMIGDRDLHLPIETSSRTYNPVLVDHVWNTARAHGHVAFDSTSAGPAVVDDHTFLSLAGIPSILVIDYDYPVWHTVHDTIDQISPASLQTVGEAIRLAISGWYARDHNANLRAPRSR